MTTRTTQLPLPGDPFAGRTVIASVWLNDDYRRDVPDADFDELGLLLLLEKEPPYFTVCQITRGHGEQDLWQLAPGTELRHHNIVEAVECYSDNGGDI